METTSLSDKWVIDRFEEDFAVLENYSLESKSIPRFAMPKMAKPGDVLFFSNGSWHIDKEETAKRREKIKTLFDRIKKKNSGNV